MVGTTEKSDTLRPEKTVGFGPWGGIGDSGETDLGGVLRWKPDRRTEEQMGSGGAQDVEGGRQRPAGGQG